VGGAATNQHLHCCVPSMLGSCAVTSACIDASLGMFGSCAGRFGGLCVCPATCITHNTLTRHPNRWSPLSHRPPPLPPPPTTHTGLRQIRWRLSPTPRQPRRPLQLGGGAVRPGACCAWRLPLGCCRPPGGRQPEVCCVAAVCAAQPASAQQLGAGAAGGLCLFKRGGGLWERGRCVWGGGGAGWEQERGLVVRAQQLRGFHLCTPPSPPPPPPLCTPTPPPTPGVIQRS
jgi:hypothetical protein